ncbi:DinB family protein [Georgenia sp. MJ173]|uniref:DinB family protein n=1 Tax=Georgenia sunbinii TaxID=3117728 RepID=UPI002F25FE20
MAAHPTGTNLLGLVKHVASIELGYFGEVFDRPSPVALPWMAEDTEDNSDMWATADESVDWVVQLYHRAWEHADATIAALDLESPGEVPWWRPGEQVTLHRILVHVIAETARHAGHADIVRELIDGEAGLRDGMTNIPAQDARWWAGYVDRLRQVADDAG